MKIHTLFIDIKIRMIFPSFPKWKTFQYNKFYIQLIFNKIKNKSRKPSTLLITSSLFILPIKKTSLALQQFVRDRAASTLCDFYLIDNKLIFI